MAHHRPTELLRRVAAGLAAGALAGTLVLALPAGGIGVDDPVIPPLTLSTTVGPPGTTFTVSGTACVNDGVGQEVTATVGFTPPLSATTTADNTGAWSVTFTVPAGTAPGSYTVNATCSSSDTTTTPPTQSAVGSFGAGTSVAAYQAAPIVYPSATFTVTAVAVEVAPSFTG